MRQNQNIISANDLRSGLNVYYILDGKNQRWDTDYSHASLFDDTEVSGAFDKACEDMANNKVVDCLIVPVDSNHQPMTTREKIRAAGPSVTYGPDQ